MNELQSFAAALAEAADRLVQHADLYGPDAITHRLAVQVAHALVKASELARDAGKE